MPPEINEAMLAAYALNELNAEDRARVESQLAEDPIARQTVADIQATASLLASELSKELEATPSYPMPALPAPRRRLATAAIGLAAAAVIAAGIGVYVHPMSHPPVVASISNSQKFAGAIQQLPASAPGSKTDLLPLPAGSNVVFGVGHADWEANPFMGTQHDNIYTGQPIATSPLNVNGAQITQKPGSSTYDDLDRILLPTLPDTTVTAGTLTAGGAVARNAAAANPSAPTSITQNQVADASTIHGANGNVASADQRQNKILDWVSNAGKADVQDKAYNQEQRKYGSGYDADSMRLSNLPTVGITPYEDTLRYAPDWPKLPSAEKHLNAEEHEDSSLPAKLNHHLPELRFNANSLSDVVDFMQDVSGEKISMDWPALEKAGITRDTPVTMKMHDVSLLDAMSLVLKSTCTGSVKAGYKIGRGTISISVGPDYRIDNPITDTESYNSITDNPFLNSRHSPLSTFATDVDTASYSNVRRFIEQGQLPPADAVRIQDLINYFPYNATGPKPTDSDPVAVNVEVADCPWQPAHRLARIALKANSLAEQKRPPSNLVFLIDVSGSMADDNKLPLLKQAIKKLVNRLTPTDRVSIVTYAGNAKMTLESTVCGDDLIDKDAATDEKYKQTVAQLWTNVYAPQLQTRNGQPINYDELKAAFNKEVAALPHSRTTGRQQILDAIDSLNADGETNGGDGIQLAYKTAVGGFLKEGVNRVILATDGDFNVGIVDPTELTTLIEKEATTGVYLTVLGLGMGNVKDATMEKLAEHGKGNYAYLDSLDEADKVLGRQLNATLVTVAKDVKLQVEFNPATVAGYRLIGYEDRAMPNKDFNNDQKTAGEMGAGHSVVALYELVPANAAAAVLPLKYQPAPVPSTNPADHELMTVSVRYQPPQGGDSRKLEVPVIDQPDASANASSDFRFTAAVASFGMILRNSPYRGNSTIDQVIDQATAARGEDVGGYRAQFIELAKRAKSLCGK